VRVDEGKSVLKDGGAGAGCEEVEEEETEDALIGDAKEREEGKAVAKRVEG